MKEVIAHGVSLRRSELWKKIRMEEPKPDDVSDRTWKSLKRELESPATVRKQENCSRANASRVNFDRTGPSGEVGVCQRLPRRFGRSPDPEEVTFEMAQDKGYGGRSKRNEPSQNVMHARQMVAVTMEDGSISGRSGHEQRESPGRDSSPPPTSDVPHEFGVKENTNVELAQDKEVASGVLGISKEQLAQHPMVICMMQRLEALEVRHILPTLRGETSQ